MKSAEGLHVNCEDFDVERCGSCPEPDSFAGCRDRRGIRYGLSTRIG